MKTITTNNKLSVAKSTVAKFNNQDTLTIKRLRLSQISALSTLLQSFQFQ
jgi:hypothetical protein